LVEELPNRPAAEEDDDESSCLGFFDTGFCVLEELLDEACFELKKSKRVVL
jgi:hypothetical protein